MHTIVVLPVSTVRKFTVYQLGILQVVAVLCCLSSSIAKCEDGIDFFEDKIEPILIDHCYRCHSEETDDPAGGFLIDSKQGIRRGGETGPAVVPEDVDESLLISAIEYRDLEMPPDEKLDDDVIADFKQWILMGAPDPRSDDGDHSGGDHSEDDGHATAKDFAKSILQRAGSAGSDADQLLKWRDEQQKGFHRLYAVDPSELSEVVCQMFQKTPVQQIVPVALTVPQFIDIPGSPSELSGSALAKWEPLRKRQFQQFLNSPNFRQRFLKLVVWQGSFCGSSSNSKSDRFAPLVDCSKIVLRHAACREACGSTGDLLSYQKLNCALLMGLTSRDDLLLKVKNGEKLGSVFNEWNQWFEASQNQLVQRRDGTGWIRIDDDNSDVLTVRYPQLLPTALPSSGQSAASASFRKLFVD